MRILIDNLPDDVTEEGNHRATPVPKSSYTAAWTLSNLNSAT